MTIDAHIVVPDADAAAAWYTLAFGAEEESRVPLPDGSVLSIVLRFGDARVHVGSEFPDFGIVSPLAIGGTATVLQINTHDADSLWAQALEAGAETHHELADQFWGERHGQLTDPFGHRWNVAHHLRDVPADEVAAAAASMFARATEPGRSRA
jgi:PhnB protein